MSVLANVALFAMVASALAPIVVGSAYLTFSMAVDLARIVREAFRGQEGESE